MARLPTLVEKTAYQQEVDRAAAEGRKPQWKDFADFLKQGQTEEDLVWGSDSMRAYGRKGRYESKQMNADSDKELGLKPQGADTTVVQQGTNLDEEGHAERFVADREAAKADGTVNPDEYDQPAAKATGRAIAEALTASDSDEDDEVDEDEVTPE